MGASAAHRVVVIGGGFGGLNAVRGLREAPVEVTLVDRQNFHLFQPLVYQVATGALASAEVAAPLRAVLKRQANARVLLANAEGFDLGRREVVLGDLLDGEAERRLPYDTLVVAGGSHYSYFGHDDWREFAPELKSIGGALKIRTSLLSAFEAAELEADPERRRAWLTFAVVGAGPTGVEMAGQIAELARDTLRGNFRASAPENARIVLLDGADRVLPAFPQGLSGHAARALEALGVEPLPGRTVVDVDAESVTWEEQGGERTRLPTRTVVWAAGVTASRLSELLAEASGAEIDKAGRVAVGPDLTLAGHPEVIALGDMVSVRDADGRPLALPGLAPVAIQQGRYVSKAIVARLQGRRPRPFHYLDKGNLATIGRSKAVADIHGLHLWGLPAWLTWLLVHIYYLIGFQNRLLVLLRWIGSFITRGRGARLIGLGAKIPDR
ncbi:MAG TPA: NAD(P)/FAD-dependent oxidoreductase [Solirubrobacterales bacterium]|nr:NAD(P)/FAD-dependent oxidoreductase [Solirubrobacterales bacterium]